MDAKLAEFRARRRRQELIESAKATVQNFLSAGIKAKEESAQSAENMYREEREPMLAAPSAPTPAPFLTGQRNIPLADDDEEWEPEAGEDEGILSKRLRRGTTVLLALVWVAMALGAVQLGLGLAFLLISAIVLMFVCTGTRRRRAGEPSAYSVFNPNCQAIDGSLNAEQFEREIRYGPTSVHR